MRIPGPLLLSASALIGSVASYAYQLLAARELGDVQFAELNLWLFWVSVASVASVVVQYYVSLRTDDAPPSRRTALVLIGGSLALLVALAGVRSSADPWISGALSVLTSLSFGYLNGKFLSLTWIGGLTTSNLAMGLARVGFLPLVGLDPEGFRRAIPAASATTTLLGALICLTAPAPARASRATELARATESGSVTGRVVGATLLAVSGAVFQFADFLVVRGSQSLEDAGLFGQAQTLGRVLFFLGMLGLQVLYPYQLRLARDDAPGKLRGWLRYGEVALFGALAIGALLLTVLGPWILVNVLQRPSAAPRSWLALSSMNFLLLAALFGRIQRAVASRTLRLPVLLVGFLLLAVASLGHLMRGQTTTVALAAISAAYVLATVVGLATRDPRTET